MCFWFINLSTFFNISKIISFTKLTPWFSVSIIPIKNNNSKLMLKERKISYRTINWICNFYGPNIELFFTGWRYYGIFLFRKPFFVPLDLDITKCILAKDFDYFSGRGIYYNEKYEPICRYMFIIRSMYLKQSNLCFSQLPIFSI